MRETYRLIAVLILAAHAAAAQAPSLINYQGRLAQGTNLVNGTVGLSLRLFDAASAGSLLYEDSNSVAVADGLYSTYLGDQTTFGALAGALSNAALYLEAAVDGVALVPRERVASVVYALQAATAQGVVPGGVTAGMLAPGAVGSAAIADGSVSNADLAASSVTSATIANSTITGLDVAANVFWEADGNSGTVPATHFLGTTDGAALRIQAGGGVGIGTTLPQAELHVADGDAGASIPSSSSVLVLERAGSSFLSILSTSNSEAGVIFGDGGDSVEGAVIFNSSGVTNGLQFRTGNNTTHMAILSNGFVGVGTTAPEAPLHVVDGTAGSVVANGNASLALERDVSNFLNLLAPDAFQSGVLFGNPGAGNSAASIVYNNALAQDSLMFTAGGSSRFIIDEQSRVGVNVFDPVESLHVAGSALRVDATNGVNVHHPTNTGAFARLDWFEDTARLRIGGTGTGAGNGFDIQRASNRSLLRIFDNGNVGIGTTNPVRDLEVFGGQSIVRVTSTNEENTAIVELKTTDPTPTLWGQVRFLDASDNVDGRFVYDDNNGGFNSAEGIGVEVGGNRVAEFMSGSVWLEEPEARTFSTSFLTPALTVTRGNTDGEAVYFVRGGFVVGSITAYSNGVIYNGFSGAHVGWMSNNLPHGALVRMTGDNRHPPGEIQYGIAETSFANDPACLGAYLSGRSGQDDDMSHLISAVGNGDMLVTDSGGDIEPGDALISSDVPGCAMKDHPDRFAIGHVIARAAERVQWADVPAGPDGVRRAKISVLFDAFTRDSRPDRETQRQIEELKARLAALEEKR